MNKTFKNENGHLVADVEFGKEEIEKAQKKAINSLANEVTVPGFRKGKAPLDKAMRYIKSDDLANETLNKLLVVVDKEFEQDESFQGYVKGNKLAPHFRPSVSVEKFSNDVASFKIVYILRPEVSKLDGYKDVKVNVTKKAITEKDIDNELSRLASNEAELVSVDREAKNGDIANIDFVGLLNGEEFDGGSSKGFDLELGSGRFVPGFEEQVVSHKAGDKFDVALTMPENYPEPLTGKPVVFKVTLNEVKVKEVPEINDEFATTLTGEYVSKDLAELKEKVKANLTKNSENGYRVQVVNNILLNARDASKFVIADEYLEDIVNDRIHEETHRVEDQGLSLEEYLKLINKSMEDYRKEMKEGVEGELKTSLIYDAIAGAEKVEIPTTADIEKQLGTSLQDFANYYVNYLKGQKMSEEQAQNQVNGYINQIFSSILTNRVQDKVLALNGFIKEEKPAEEKKEEKAEEAKSEEKPAAKKAPAKKPASSPVAKKTTSTTAKKPASTGAKKTTTAAKKPAAKSE